MLRPLEAYFYEILHTVVCFVNQVECVSLDVVNGPEPLLLDTPLLGGATAEDVRVLVSLGAVRIFPPGSVVFREGDPGDSFHTILEGTVRITISSPDGAEFT